MSDEIKKGLLGIVVDETEVSKMQYREYLWWLRRTFYADFPEVYRKALPDTLV